MLPHPKGAGPDLQQTVLQMPLAHDAAMHRVKPALTFVHRTEILPKKLQTSDLCQVEVYPCSPARIILLRNASTLLSISGTCTGVEILGVHLRDLRYASTLLSMSRTFTGVVNLGVIKRTLRYASTLLSMSGTYAGR